MTYLEENELFLFVPEEGMFEDCFTTHSLFCIMMDHTTDQVTGNNVLWKQTQVSGD